MGVPHPLDFSAHRFWARNESFDRQRLPPDLGAGHMAHPPLRQMTHFSHLGLRTPAQHVRVTPYKKDAFHVREGAAAAYVTHLLRPQK
jgi:hypothetical protein